MGVLLPLTTILGDTVILSILCFTFLGLRFLP